MLLENSEEWTLAESNLTFSIGNNDQFNTQQTQISQELLNCQPPSAINSALLSIEYGNCDIVNASVSNLSTKEDPLAVPSTSRLEKRKLSLDDSAHLTHKRIANLSTDQYSSILSIASTCTTREEAYCSNIYVNDSQLSVQDDTLSVSVTSGVEENSSSQGVDDTAATPDPNTLSQKCTAQVPVAPKNNDLPTSVKLAKFEVDWKIIPNDVMHQLQGRQPNVGYRGISETNYNRFVDHVTAQIRTTSSKIPFFVFRRVALKIINKYPTLRDCDDEGHTIGDGSNSLADKLRNHNAYLNRAHRSEVHTTRRKVCFNRRCTVGVRPEYFKSGTNHCSKDLLIVLTRKRVDNLNEDALIGTEAFIRHKIDSSINLHTLHQELPSIGRNEVLNYHFYRATGCSAEAFSTNFAKKRAKLIEVSKSYKRPLHIPSKASDFEVLEGVSRLLGENVSSLIHEIEDIHEMQSTDNFPSIVFLDQTDNGQKFFIQAENTLLTLGVNNIIHAFQQLLAVYFVYFYKYPKDVSKTLEFLQMFLLKLYPENGTRSTATIVGRHQRMVTSLISKISKLDWRKQQTENKN
ncbi:uncharacterized protein LOC135714407 isoform X1 [Ochlerotatus camptorhynchus]|uniref:uncharacterized protein LOC135714407 isoform X1 n=1 Tax=Ochlerotatus camptorhynchus TaxID=644619 RepID=UPI0031D0DFC2